MTEFYEERPSVLPATLPVGTRFFYVSENGLTTDNGLVAVSELRLSGKYYVGKWRHKDGTESFDQATCEATSVDWRSVPRAAPSPEPKVESWHGFAKGERVIAGFQSKTPGTVVGGTEREVTVLVDASQRICGWIPSAITRLSPPAPSSPSYPNQLICDDCGKPIADVIQACKRTRVNAAGFKEYVPGAFHAKCPEQESPPVKTTPKRDPYVEHRNSLTMAVADWHATQTGIASGLSKIDQAKAQLDRKLPTVRVGCGWDGMVTRGRLVQAAAPWDSEDVDWV